MRVDRLKREILSLDEAGIQNLIDATRPDFRETMRASFRETIDNALRFQPPDPMQELWDMLADAGRIRLPNPMQDMLDSVLQPYPRRQRTSRQGVDRVEPTGRIETTLTRLRTIPTTAALGEPPPLQRVETTLEQLRFQAQKPRHLRLDAPDYLLSYKQKIARVIKYLLVEGEVLTAEDVKYVTGDNSDSNVSRLMKDLVRAQMNIVRTRAPQSYYSDKPPKAWCTKETLVKLKLCRIDD
jgi:hypothetical protein